MLTGEFIFITFSFRIITFKLQVFQEARRNIPSVVYVPGIDELWNLVTETVKSIILSQLSQMDPNIPILFLATAHVTLDNLPSEVSKIEMLSNYQSFLAYH